MQNQENRRGSIHFAELETAGQRVECPRCHAPFTPHLGILIAARFPCRNCKVSLSYRSSTGTTVRCPCCTSWRPMLSLKTLVCGGCDVTVIYQKGDRSVKCFLCKHITYPPEANDGLCPFYQVLPPQVIRVVPHLVNRVVPPQVFRTVPPQTNRVIPPQVNRVVPPQTHQVIPLQVNRVVPPQVFPTVPPQTNQVIPPQVNRVVPPQTHQVIPLQVNRVVPPQVFRTVPPQTNQIIPPQVNRVVPPHTHQVIPLQVNRVVPPQVNRVVPPQVFRTVPPQTNQVIPLQVNRVVPPQMNQRSRKAATAETESTATSSSTLNPEESARPIVYDYFVRLMRDYAPRIRTNKREVEEEDKTEPKNKKSRH